MLARMMGIFNIVLILLPVQGPHLFNLCFELSDPDFGIGSRMLFALLQLSFQTTNSIIVLQTHRIVFVTKVPNTAQVITVFLGKL